MREQSRLLDWVVLINDVHPDELKHYLCKTAFLYAHTNEYRPVEAARRAKHGSVAEGNSVLSRPGSESILG